MSESNTTVKCTWPVAPGGAPCGKSSVEAGSIGRLSYGVLRRDYCEEHIKLQRTPASK